ncbi:MAG: hypothetical protein HKN77_10265 [Woeseiaceae bacterium]|nr:hypothetical protein [Woeseiaceae bacterium]
MSDPGDFVTDYDLGIPPLEALGWRVTLLPWQQANIDWNTYDAVYICTPWDYLDDPDLFLSVLGNIDASNAILVNDMALVRWSLEKSYLADLESRGADIVPSSWHSTINVAVIDDFFSHHGTDRVVIKPLIGANAADTFVLEKTLTDEMKNDMIDCFSDRQYFVQPFIASIQSVGEYSLFYLGGEYSHGIQKTPKPGDFRVQEEHGADIVPVDPSAELLTTADKVMRLIDPQPVYARADFVVGADERYLLMELELIEPSLYLRTNEHAASRFAQVFDTHVRAMTSKDVSASA